MPLIAHWTSKDLDVLPKIEGVRYEIIDGELYVSTSPCWTSKDLKRFPTDLGLRYEIIDGELYVSTAPSFRHQYAASRLIARLDAWNSQAGRGTSWALLASSLPQTGTSFLMSCGSRTSVCRVPSTRRGI